MSELDAELKAIAERAESNYRITAVRTHRDYHEKHQQWPEETSECSECEAEYEEARSTQTRLMGADVSRLLKLVGELQAELAAKDEQLTRGAKAAGEFAEKCYVEQSRLTAELSEAKAEIERLHSLVYLPKILPDDADVSYADYSSDLLKRHNARLAELENTQDEISRLKAEDEWQPIESAPKEQSVLLGAEGCDQIVKGYAMYIDELCTEKHHPTRWKPLPLPPNQGEK